LDAVLTLKGRTDGPTTPGGWEDAESFLQSLSADDLDQLAFSDCERHPLP
jgi:hypothetical protein